MDKAIDAPEINIKLQKFLKTSSAPEIDKNAEEEWKVFVAKKAWDNIEKNISPKERDVFMGVNEGCSAAELAAQSGLSESSVYVYKQRVQNKLIKEIYRLEKEIG